MLGTFCVTQCVERGSLGHMSQMKARVMLNSFLGFFQGLVGAVCTNEEAA